ncbi:hypothetical protein MMC27_007581 [Xylographa pallens]|nr:hypothetical protein [Xylographa pallens]
MSSSIETTSSLDVFLDLVSFTSIGCVVGLLVFMWRRRVKEALDSARAGAIPPRRWSCTIIIVLTAFHGIVECIIFYRFLYALSTVLDDASKDERYSGPIWSIIHFMMFFIYGTLWGTSLALCVFGFLKLVSILLEIHGMTGQILPRKGSTSSESSVLTELDTDIEAQLHHESDLGLSITSIQQISSGESGCQGGTLGSAVKDELWDPQTIFEHPVEADSNPESLSQYISHSQDQDVGSAGEDSSERPKVYTPLSSTRSEAGDSYSLDDVSSDPSSDWEDMSEDADDTSEIDTALDGRLDAELDVDIDWESGRLYF